MSSAEVALRPEERAVHGFELAERVFTPERRQAIAKFLNVEAEEPALPAYLAICASYGLDPVMGQVWLIPQRVKVRDAAGKSMFQDRYRPAAGRDGYLAIARRDVRYQGLKSAVVCEHDSFEVVYDGSQDEPKVLHRFASKPTAFDEGEAPDRYRGRILGAWAKAYAAGMPPVFYFAPLREHGKLQEKWEGSGENRHRVRGPDGGPVMEWSGAWSYTSGMILKAAEVHVLRIAFGITGLVPVDELRDPSDPDALVVDAVEEEFDFSGLDASEDLIRRLRAVVAEANELSPLSWPPAKCEMVMAGRSEAELEELAGRIEHENELHAARIDPAQGQAPAESEPEPQGQAEEGEPEDAQVVELSEEQRERLAGLRSRAADLQAGMDECEPGGEEHASLAAELDQVEAEMRAVSDPGQGRLDV